LVANINFFYQKVETQNITALPNNPDCPDMIDDGMIVRASVRVKTRVRAIGKGKGEGKGERFFASTTALTAQCH